MKIKFTAISLLISVLALPAFAQPLDQFSGVVKIQTVSCKPNFFLPWLTKGQSRGSGSGVVISGNRILTNAHNVSDSTYVSVLKKDNGSPVSAKVVAIDHQCDLAILEVPDKRFFDGITPFEIGETPPVRTQVLAVGYPLGGDGLSITQGIISRIEAVAYSHSMLDSFLAAQLDAAINPGNSGGPILYNGKVVGIAFQGYKGRQGLGYMIHTDVIRHFLKDIQDGTVDGFGDLGISIITLENPDTRKYLKMSETQSGVLVCRVRKFAGENPPVKKGDVLLTIDGKTIMNNGNITADNGENRHFSTIVDSKQMGEFVNFGILRDGKKLEVKMYPKKPYFMVSPMMYDKSPKMYVAGGLVFTTLSLSYLSEWTKQNPPEHLSRLIDEEKDSPEDEVVVLSVVLGDEVNLGYQSYASSRLYEINGQKIKSIKDVARIIDSLNDGYVTFVFDYEVPIILDVKKMKKAMPRIMRNYRLPADRSKDL